MGERHQSRRSPENYGDTEPDPRGCCGHCCRYEGKFCAKKRIATLLALVDEGYTAEFEPSGDADREVKLKTGQWVNVWDIPEYFKDQEAIEDLRAFRNFQRLGWPYGPWAMNPAPYVDVMQELVAVDQIYHPKVTL